MPVAEIWKIAGSTGDRSQAWKYCFFSYWHWPRNSTTAAANFQPPHAKPCLTKGLAFESITHTECFVLGEALHQSAHFRFGEQLSQSATYQSSKRIPFTPLHLEMNQSG